MTDFVHTHSQTHLVCKHYYTSSITPNCGLQHNGTVVFWNGNGYHKDCLPLPANMPPGAEGAKLLETQYYNLKDPNHMQVMSTLY